ncbi:methyltransferase domain-containing protein [Xylophilus sp. GW821-FHT01B05]
MSDEIIGLHPWFDTPPGRYLLQWEQECFDQAVADLFGYHGVQLGLPLLDGLRANRMPHHWQLGTNCEAGPAGAPVQAALVADSTALPFAAASLDLLLLPHALETSADPHATLREVERVLVPEGRVVICGLNPVSFWGLKQRRALLAQRLGFGRRYLPDAVDFIGYWRLRDWLRLLSFEVESVQFGCWRPAVRSQRWLDRYAWMDQLGDRWWPIFGAAYFVVAVKRVHGMRLMDPGWKTVPARTAATPASVASRGPMAPPPPRF